jgi:hypothetical protein
MATDLQEMQFELLPTLTAGAGQVFGIGGKVSVNGDDGWDPGEDDWETQDETNPRRGGTAFGRDTLNGPTWAFNLHVNERNVGDAVDTLGQFKTAWRAVKIRQTPGAVIPIRYRINNRVRRAYGRPRRFAAPPNNMILSGFVPITADFACVDGYTYDGVESVVTLGLQAQTEGGLIFPLVFPFESLTVGETEGSATVGGDAPTYPIVTFRGPVRQPGLSTPAWSLELNTELGEGEVVVVDLRPWAMSALKQDGSSVAGTFARRTRLVDMKLEPGQTRLSYRGATSSASATCEVRWSNAWNSI